MKTPPNNWFVLVAFVLSCLLPQSVIAAPADRSPAQPVEANSSTIESWWQGKNLTGNWLGARDSFADIGLTFQGKYYGAYFGIVDSQNGSRGVWDQGLDFGAEQNFGKMFGVDALSGVKGFGQFRWRDARSSADPNEIVEASSMFNPSNWISGVQFRILAFGLEIGSAKHLPVDDMVVFRGGWLQPQKEFLDQTLSKLFLNNAVASAKGVGGNIPFSSSASTWGGTLRIKPLDWYYAKAGLFMAFPGMTNSDNHGLAFQGFAADSSRNGLWAMGETGVTPKLGTSSLPGKYAVGGYYYGGEKDSFNGTDQYGQLGFYWQADQMLFREPSAGGSASSGKGPSEGKSFKSPVPVPTSKLNEQGLSMFNVFTFAPKYNNLYPFYFHSGLVYKGLIPARDEDLTMFSLAFGNYSYYNLLEQRENGKALSTYTMFLEWGYRVQINPWAFFQPFAQYAIRPNGTNSVGNATILGFSTGVNF